MASCVRANDPGKRGPWHTAFPCPHQLVQAVRHCPDRPKSCCRSLGSCRRGSRGTRRGWGRLQGPGGWRLTVTDSSTSCPSCSQHQRWRGGDLKFACSIQPRGRLSSPLPTVSLLSPAVPVALCRRKPGAWCLWHFSCPARSRGAARRGFGAVRVVWGCFKEPRPCSVRYLRAWQRACSRHQRDPGVRSPALGLYPRHAPVSAARGLQGFPRSPWEKRGCLAKAFQKGRKLS